MRPIAVLFARADSVYKTLPGADVWDAERDARLWPGGSPIVAHPPCAQWGRLRGQARVDLAEKALAPWAVERVRRWGGVLEHPATSTLWDECSLPGFGRVDRWGGWTLPIHQHSFGHRAQKSTLLYIVGVRPEDVPRLPLQLGEPSHVVQTKRMDMRPHLLRSERDSTPEPLAQWLLTLARMCHLTETATA
jgi:hypothetical protein